MSLQTEIPSLASLEFLSYLGSDGKIDENIAGKIGVYGIFDHEQSLSYVGYSRDIYLSLKQHLIRQPDRCHWIKLQTIERPSRKILDEIATAWISENGSTPAGNDTEQHLWTDPIDANPAMTEDEKAQYQQSEESKQIKIRKQVARRVEAEILEQLRDRGVQMEIRFNPKLKEKGLLDLK
ncbi:MAG: GIY-YIG nuclease family protein [Cyanobacteria bacterium J06623_7]